MNFSSQAHGRGSCLGGWKDDKHQMLHFYIHFRNSQSEGSLSSLVSTTPPLLPPPPPPLYSSAKPHVAFILSKHHLQLKQHKDALNLAAPRSYSCGCFRCKRSISSHCGRVMQAIARATAAAASHGILPLAVTPPQKRSFFFRLCMQRQCRAVVPTQRTSRLHIWRLRRSTCSI